MPKLKVKKLSSMRSTLSKREYFHIDNMRIQQHTPSIWNVMFLHESLTLKEAKERISKYFYVESIYVAAGSKAYDIFLSEGKSYYFRIKGRVRDPVALLEKSY